ncbi:MAG TPA: hypothetical protein P5232_04315 [Candidatus Moranbacteria bacterium]|nr:hypothetical protein [Candidatus Moranbacteria bacterium]
MNIKLKTLFLKNKVSEKQLEKYEKVLVKIEDNIQEYVAGVLSKDINLVSDFIKILDRKLEALSKNDMAVMDEVIKMEKNFMDKIEK